MITQDDRVFSDDDGGRKRRPSSRGGGRYANANTREELEALPTAVLEAIAREADAKFAPARGADARGGRRSPFTKEI